MEEEAEAVYPIKPDFRQRHLSDVTSALGGLWRRRLFTDLTLIVNGKCVRCHRVVLASVSSYFYIRLFNGRRESSIDKLFIRDVSWEVLSEVLEFVYSGECALREDNAEDLLKAAAVFQIVALKDMCDSFLEEQVQAENALHLYTVARSTRSPRLERKSLEVIHDNLPHLLGTKPFRQLDHHDLTSITASCDSQKQSEDTLYDAVKVWLQADKARRKRVLGEILKRVPLSQAHQEDLQTMVAEDVPAEEENEKKVTISQKTQKKVPKKEKPKTPQEATAVSQSPQPTPPVKQLEECLVMVGGITATEGGYQRSQCVYALHPSSTQWFSLTSLPLNSDSGSAYCVHSNHIFISGVGDSRTGLVKYDAGQNSWQVLAPMSIGRRGHSMVVQGSCLHVLGGMTQIYDCPQLQDQKPHITAVVESYSIRNNSWTVTGNLAEAVWGASAVVFKDKVHLFGGFQDKDRPTSLVQMFDPQSRTGRLSSQLPFPVALSQVLVTKEEVLLMAPSGAILTTPDCWRFKVALSLAGFRRALFGMAVNKGQLYVVGGKRGQTVHDDVVTVDVGSGTVTQLAERAPGPVWGCGFFTVAVDRALLLQADQKKGEETGGATK